MNKEIVNNILKRINDKIRERECKISEDELKEIIPLNESKRIVFIDGGQAEVIKAVDFSLQFIRVVGLSFKADKKIGTKLNEFFVLISAVEEKGKILFETEIFPVKGDSVNNIIIDSLDSTIKKGNERAESSDIGGIIRRFSELRLAKEIVEEMEEGDIVVLDGNLKNNVKDEEKYLNELFETGYEKGVLISSLAKTSRIFVENGSCLLSNLNKVGNKEYPWYYELKEGAVVKLNKSSEHVFELNIYEKQKNNINSVLGILVNCSKDAVFPGYPYGLLMVDKMARVSNQEKEFLLTLFKARAGKSWRRVNLAINALNSHDRLDNIG